MENKENKSITIRFRVTEEENKKIEQLAIKLRTTKSKMIRTLLLGNIDNVHFLTNIKVLPIFQQVHAYANNLKGINYWEELQKDDIEDVIEESEMITISKKEYLKLLKAKELK